MKKLLIITFLLLGLTSYAQKPQRGTSRLNVRISLDSELVLSCHEEDVEFSITRKHVTLKSMSVSIDLTVIKRKIGEHDSWLGKTVDNKYYLISALVTTDGQYSMMVFTPVDENLIIMDDLPMIQFTNAPICK